MEAGAEILVTRRGQPVARIVPVQTSRERQLTPEQEAAHARTIARLSKGWDLGGGKFNRDELYDDRGWGIETMARVDLKTLSGDHLESLVENYRTHNATNRGVPIIR